MADIKKLIDEIKKLTIVELNDLVKEIEKEFGVTAAAPVTNGTAKTTVDFNGRAMLSARRGRPERLRLAISATPFQP